MEEVNLQYANEMFNTVHWDNMEGLINNIERATRVLLNVPFGLSAWRVAILWGDLMRPTLQLHHALMFLIEDRIISLFGSEQYHLTRMQRFHIEGTRPGDTTFSFFYRTLPHLLIEIRDTRRHVSNQDHFHLFALDTFHRLVSALITISRHVLPPS